MSLILVILLLFFSYILIKAADLTVIALKKISEKTHTRSFVVSVILLAIGTSFPEFFVGVTSALEGTPELSFGNVLGANIANISLIVGVSALAGGRVIIRGTFLTRDVWIALVSGLAPILFILDGVISRPDGVVLIVIYIAYATSFFHARFIEIGHAHEPDKLVYRFLRQINHTGRGNAKNFIRLAVGVLALLVSADVIVRIASSLAETAGIPIFVIGLVVLSLGTSLPELVFSLKSVKNREIGMFLGNVLGSVIANSTLVVGFASLIHPIRVEAAGRYFVAGSTFVTVALLFWFFGRTKHRIDWWEALLMLAIYVAFVIFQFT